MFSIEGDSGEQGAQDRPASSAAELRDASRPDQRVPAVARPGAAVPSAARLVVKLGDPVVDRVGLLGGKAASLAVAAEAGLHVLPAVVLTTEFCALVDAGAPLKDQPALREAFEAIGGSKRKIVARSSSPVEDLRDSSMAGQFESVIGIDGFDAFVEAVAVVQDSRVRAGAADLPIAVLVQPFIEPRFGGVLFGADPVSGRIDRRVVSAVAGGPDVLVSGEVDGSRYLLDTRSKVIEHDANDGPDIPLRDLKRLVELSTTVADVFGGPQDVEWAIDTDGKLWLLQSRFVTTELHGIPTSTVYGPGPVAETFPEPLTELEVDLWVPPLEDAVRSAVTLAGSATPAQIQDRDLVVDVAGHVAIDLRLAGEIAAPRTFWSFLNPVPAARRLYGAWRVGRLRVALPRLAEDLLDRVDADLEGVPALEKLTNRQLLALCHRSRAVLKALHSHEILIGMLTDTGHNRMTGASVALRILDEARREGVPDREIIRRSPAVLALTAPRIGPGSDLPADAVSIPVGTDCDNANDNGILREALRMRVRWLQELTGRAAWTIGERLAATGALQNAELVRHVSFAQLQAVAMGQAVTAPALLGEHVHDYGHPLPARFQLSDLGEVIAVRGDRSCGGGTGAGGGQGTGQVTYDVTNPPEHSVLVTTTLQPGLGPLLYRLDGIVAETGSVLSHLAILAREAGVATVVGYRGATEDLAEGSVVTVDGDTGQVTIEAPAQETVAS